MMQPRMTRMKRTEDMTKDMTHDIQATKPGGQLGEIILYQPDETVRLEVSLEDETVWLTQAQMAELFQKDQSVIARHIGNVFREGELEEKSNMQILHNTLSKYTSQGVRPLVRKYDTRYEYDIRIYKASRK